MKKHPAAPAAELSTAQRRYFYFTAAITGGAIMIVEILGAKMLSPYIGTSHFVWTAQIAVAMIALALGYYVGGKLVDRVQRPGVLYWAILLSALYLTLTVAFVEPVAFACIQLKPFAFGSLLASILLFFVPLSLLAVVGPFVVRIITSAVSTVGGNMGRLTAVSTFGSFAGTVLIGYVLIPFLPNSVTMYLLALLLAAVCLGYFVVWGRRQAPLAPVVLVVLGIVLAGWGGVRHDRKQHAGAQVKFYGNSNYGMLQVLDLGSTRYYLNDWLVQNTYDPATGQSTSEFTYMLHGLAQAYTSNINHALAIGLGVGIVPMQFVADGAKVDVVEINPSVVPLGVQYFGLQPDKMNLAIADGREFLNNAPTDLYDTIALDAFLGESSPSHLMTREAFLQMQRVLRPGGTLVINSFGSFEAGEDFFTTSLYRTLTNVFASVRIHTSGRNIYFVASDREPLAMVNAPLVEHVHSVARADVEAAYAGLVEPGTEVRGHAFDPSRGRVLTDDFNPVDFFDAPNRELIRRELALNWRRRQ